MKMKKRFISIFLCTLLTLGTVASAALDLTSGAAFVMNTDTGDSYYEFNADEALAPASMTKVMTAYIVYKKLADNTISKDTRITADAEDAMLSRDTEATNVPINEGQSYTVDEILGAIFVPSACAACEMIGKYLCKSEEEFVKLMNSTAQEMGLNAHYADASGLSNDNRISARSMAALATAFINEYPDVLSYTSRLYTTFDGHEYKNTNRLIAGGVNEYWGADGLKTGTTTLAGCCLTSTAQRGDVRIVAVTMRSASSSARVSDSVKLLNYGFSRADYLYNSLFATDMRLFINGYEVPAFCYMGPRKGIYFIFEDLKDYGFDIVWDAQTKTVTAYKNPEKKITPIPMEMYRSYSDGSKMFDVTRNSGITAKIVCGGTELTFPEVCSMNGYVAVSADELGNIADSCVWNESEKLLEIQIN